MARCKGLAVLFLQGWIGLLVRADTQLDKEFFLRIATTNSQTVETVVVQANWQEDQVTINDTSTGWLPVRLFGTTDADALTLAFTSSSRVGDPPKPRVTVRTRDSQSAADITDGSDSGQIVMSPAKIVAGGAKNRWWWEGFLFVNNSDPTAGNTPVVVRVQIGTGSANEQTLDLVMGDCWLMAGGARLAARLDDKDVNAPAAIVAVSPRGLSCVAMDSASAQVLRVQDPKVNGIPALGGMFAVAMSAVFQGGKTGARPVCVYTWSQSRKLMADWVGASGLGPAWDRLLTGNAKDAVFPGVRGVLWAHGEWEAEFGDFQATTPTGAQRGFEDDVGAFQQRYVDAETTLRARLFERLAQTATADTSTDGEIAKRLLWVVAQSPGAGRITEFYDAFTDSDPADVDSASPASAWAALRAAQFAVVDGLRKSTWLKRPKVLLVPLQGSGDSGVGWLWTLDGNPDRERYVDAGRRIADEVFRALTQPESDDPDAFADGWPRVEWHGNTSVDPAQLKFTGVTSLAPPAVVPAQPGVRPAAFLAKAGDKWTPVPVPAGQAVLALPAGTVEIRYAWADAVGAAYTRLFAAPAGAALSLPAFQITLPAPTPVPP